ncbi:MAG: S41 family peptidase [Bdellovibrionota bacterium]
MKNFLITLVLFLSITGAQAASLTQAQRASDYDTLHAMFASQYGMAAIKKDLVNVDFETVWSAHRDAAVNAASDEDFYTELQKTVGEFKDAHVSLVRPSDEKAMLGFRVDRFGDKAIVTEIDRTILKDDYFPVTVGDELVSMDGEAASKIAERQASYRHGASVDSELGYGYITLTKRSGRFYPIPSGDVKLHFKRVDGSEIDLGLPWIHSGRPLGGARLALASDLGGKTYRSPLTLRADFIDIDGMGFSQESQAIRFELPVPRSAVVISKDPLAYVISTPKGPMGFVRLDTFSPDDTQATFKAYQEIFRKFDVLTAGVIIDMRGNGGGSIEYGFDLASLLIDHPIPAEKVSWRVTPTRIMEFRQGMANDKNLAERAEDQFIQGILEVTFASGQAMTPFVPFRVGNTVIPDSDVNYSHPVELLVDDQCYSMCDFFSALMQDVKRATIVGVPTGAAGGPVDEFAPLPYSGVTPHITIGIGQRANGQLIENHPIQPDVRLEMDPAEVATGYAKYRAATWKVLLDLK